MTVHLPLFSSLAQSISVSLLEIRPFLGFQQARVITQATPAKSDKWPAEIRIKESSPDREHSFNALVRYWAHQDNKKEETMPDCPATMPRGPGTTHLSTLRYLAPHSPATTSTAAAAIPRGPTTSQPRIQCMSSPAADQTPLCHMVTLFSGCSQHRWGRPSDITANLGNWATIHSTPTVRLETLINIVICVLPWRPLWATPQ